MRCARESQQMGPKTIFKWSTRHRASPLHRGWLPRGLRMHVGGSEPAHANHIPPWPQVVVRLDLHVLFSPTILAANFNLTLSLRTL